MTTLYIRYPARAAADSGAIQPCHFALLGDSGNVMQQGASALGSMAELVASARRVVLMLAAADVTLLRVKTPPLSAARLKAALPALVEDQLLGDPADCILALAPLGPDDSDGERTVAVVQRAWLDVLVKALVAQGAHAVSAVPAQLCLPLQPGGASAAIALDNAGLELTLRTGHQAGLGLTVAPEPEAALATLRALAGEAPLAVYVPAALAPHYQPVAAGMVGVSLEHDNWTHWVAAARTAGPDLAAGMATGTQARAWRRWRWPAALALLAVLVNVVGLNIEWLRMKRESADIRKGMEQTFRAAYPQEAMLDAVAQMRRNIATAKAGSGEQTPDEFTALAAALGEALASAGKRDVVAGLAYKDRVLTVKLKPNAADAGVRQQVNDLLKPRQLALSEGEGGVWQIRMAGGKS
ncbi:MAG: general secretion pathway protein GspL [Burkholderiaceae bacterium]|nr:general secretion pathway protein GspL [Burkholderiaceae bacterium]